MVEEIKTQKNMQAPDVATAIQDMELQFEDSATPVEHALGKIAVEPDLVTQKLIEASTKAGGAGYRNTFVALGKDAEEAQAPTRTPMSKLRPQQHQTPRRTKLGLR